MTAPAWDLLPEDLRRLGWPRDPGYLLGRLHRLATWNADGPVLSRPASAFVDAEVDLALPVILNEAPSADGATRVLLALADGARIEAVHMPRTTVRPRATICLSSQVGCAMGCTFCATGAMGLARHLSADEIVGQLFAVARRFGPASADRLNVVFMGMGEPLHNVDAVVRALDVMTEPAGFGLAPSRITVSTVGHLPGLARLAARARRLPELAVSVNAATDDVRRRLVPIGQRWPLAELRAAIEAWPRRPHQKITLEYVLLAGVNDDVAAAERLAAWALGLRHVLNVIPFNAWGDARSPYRAPSDARVSAFVAVLRSRGCLVTVRRSRGRDVRAACGTLATAPT